MFIVVEGVDGSGKSTLVSALKDHLNEIGIPTVATREPGGTMLAEQIRGLVIENKLDVHAETYLFFAARIHHWQNLIKPSMDAGNLVISDRFISSTWVYQVTERGLPMDSFDHLMEDFYRAIDIEGLPVQHEFLLDLPFAVAEKRLLDRSAAKNRFDSPSLSSFERRREAYHAAMDNVNNWSEQTHLVSAVEPVQDLVKKISDVIQRRTT